MSIASIGLCKKKFSAEEYKQARGKATKNAVSALQAPSALMVLDRVRSYRRNRRNDVGVMEGMFARLRLCVAIRAWREVRQSELAGARHPHWRRARRPWWGRRG